MKKSILVVLLFCSTIFAKEFEVLQNSVIDYKNRLQWQDSIEISEFYDIWRKASAGCKGLVLDGKSDWRLPSVKELKSLANSKIKSKFRYLNMQVFWSSEDDKDDEFNAYTVFIGNGFLNVDDKCNDNYRICVRDIEN